MPRTTSARKGRAAAADDSTPKAGAISLEDLSPEARAQLLKEARANVNGGDTPTDADAERRNDQLRALMDPRDHLRDCPMDGRYEAYGDRKPADARSGVPAKDVTLVRCIECGGNNVLEEPYGSVMQRLEEESGKDD